MFPIQHTLFLLIKVLLAFGILYIFLPSRLTVFDEHGDDWTDKVMVSMTHSHVIIIILVHLLVVLRIYETISLFIAIIALTIFIISLRAKRARQETEEKRSAFSLLLDVVDGRLGNKTQRRQKLSEYLKKAPAALMRGITHAFIHPFDGVILFALFGVAAAIRFSHAMQYLYYGASDCYVHLAWAKYLGVNKLYYDGVYPYGYEAIISALQKLFFIDPAVIVRFYGGIGSMLIVFSIFYILRKNMKGKYILIFAGVAAYVLGTELPNETNNIWRQLSALPQEYAAAFVLPGIHFLNVFFNTGRRRYLALAAEVLAITVFIHFYAAAFLGIGYAFLTLFHFGKLFRGKTLPRLIGYLGFGGAIGILPIAVALGLGMKFHQLSLGFVAESATVSTALDWHTEIFRYREVDPTLKLVLFCALAVAVYTALRAFFKKSPAYASAAPLTLTIAAMSVLSYTQVRAEYIGFPSLLEFSRASTFFGFVAVALLALTIYLLVEFLPVHKLVKYVAGFGMSAFVLMTVFQPQNYAVMQPTGAKLEYDEAAYAYYKIKEDFPILNWTIISPVEQYQQSMGYGWHYNLWEFVKDIQIDKKEEVSFPTDYVFVIVEKKPLNQAKPYTEMPEITTEDASQPFPDMSGSPEKYYTIYENRRVIEAKAYYWMEEYMGTKGNFAVYWEDDKLKIYMLKQDGTEPVNLAQ